VIPLRGAFAVVMAAATAVVALAQLNLPSNGFWQEPVAVGTQWASVSVMAAFILINEFRAVSHLAYVGRIRDYDLDLRATLSAVLCSVAEVTGANWDELTVCYYRQKGFWVWCRLVRAATVMLGAGGSATPPSLRPGEGLVGVAFVREELLAEEWASFVQTATDQGPVAWKRRGEIARYGLKWGQLRSSSRDQGMIASPTFDHDGMATGCILISGPLKLPDLVDPLMRRILDDLATALSHVGSPPRGWWSAHER